MTTEKKIVPSGYTITTQKKLLLTVSEYLTGICVRAAAILCK